MKQFALALFSIMFLFVVANLAYSGTAGGIAPAVGKVNVSLTVPKVSKSECKNMAAGKTGAATFDVSGTTMVNWKAFTSDTNATAVNVKRKFNTNTAYMPGTGETNLAIEAKASSLVFNKFSTADNSVTPKICVDMN